jgi:DNA-binding NarL/FixJ family response regulator
MFRTLVVDDHVGFRAGVRSVLESEFPDIQVEEAGDGSEALDKIARFRTDLVLMDIKLPGDNGIQVTRVIKATYDGVAVVILTGFDLPQYRQAAFRNGADCYLYKGSATCMTDVLARVEGAMQARKAAS